MEDFSELYYRTPYVRAFDATVTGCAPTKGGYEVTLSETAFYPEGGGQPGDRGTLAVGAGDDQAVVRVLDTTRRDDVVRHLCDAPLPVGATAHGELDWTWRRDTMEAHTGEHVVSGIVHARFGYDNVGFHMGESCIEVDFSGPIDDEQALEVERAANDAIRADLPVRALLPSPEELAAMIYRSKKELDGVVRIVSIPGIDACACCGVHVQTTGQVGLVKVVGATTKKKGTRLELLCGRRALLAFEAEMAQVRGISTLLSAKPHEVLDAVRRLDDEKAELARQLKAANRRCIDLEVAALPSAQEPLVRFAEQRDIDELRYFCNQALEAHRAPTVAALSATTDGEAISYVIASATADLRPIVKRLNADLAGRGGGRPEMVQGSFRAPRAQVEAALREQLA